MKLKEGKMSWRELSIWFGLKPDSINKNPKAKENKLQKLKVFADFHLDEKGKLIIDKVHISEYSKPLDVIEKELLKRWGNIKDSNGEIIQELKEKRIDTCARVACDIWYNIPVVQDQITLDTAKAYVSRKKRDMYGRNYVFERGTKGYSKYIWVNKEENAPLTKEELNTLKECANLAYGDVNLLLIAIEEDYREGNLSEEEYISAKGSIEISDSYDRFRCLVKQKLKFLPKKRTQLVDFN